jgi:hypothetical protein
MFAPQGQKQSWCQFLAIDSLLITACKLDIISAKSPEATKQIQNYGL